MSIRVMSARVVSGRISVVTCQAAPVTCRVKSGPCPCPAGRVVPDRGVSACPCHVVATLENLSCIDVPVQVLAWLAGRLGSDDLMFGRFSRSDFLFRSDVQGADLMEHRSDA